MTPLAVWTIGHSNHALDAFAELLAAERIEFVADVRSYPYSRFASQYNREPLQEALRAREIGYLFLGEELGGRPAADEHYDADGHALYGPMSQEPRFREAIDRVVTGARSHRIALLCSEADPQCCHRRLLVGKVLTEQGVELHHILAGGTVRIEREVPVAAGQQGSLLDEDTTAWRSTQSVSHRRRLSTSSVG
jgi:uncharacterized protein (DUF488 family)